MVMKRLEEAFFARSCILVAQDMVGKLICRKTPEGEILTLRITEAEAY
ncbi:MAG: DNA-3-methyladenine glycosylase, partial [Ruminococcaceae bacterium]|nr:DNA-3-methyladenine glycosylase [Oscillospiraceae bacterium]